MNINRRHLLKLAASIPTTVGIAQGATMHPTSAVIEDLSREAPRSTIGTSWQFITDGVMGGVSNGSMAREAVAGRLAVRLRGNISLENNGGFIQMAIDLAPGGSALDASAWRGIELDAFGNGEEYGMHLRTADLNRPWQSYRHSFRAEPRWQTFQLEFKSFMPHRTDVPLDTRRLRRIGIVAIGRAFSADIAIGAVRYLA